MMKELENTLAEQIVDLEINTSEPCETTMESVYLDRAETNNSRWIDAALQYGELKDSSWKYGKVFIGEVKI